MTTNYELTVDGETEVIEVPSVEAAKAVAKVARKLNPQAPVELRRVQPIDIDAPPQRRGAAAS